MAYASTRSSRNTYDLSKYHTTSHNLLNLTNQSNQLKNTYTNSRPPAISTNHIESSISEQSATGVELVKPNPIDLKASVNTCYQD